MELLILNGPNLNLLGSRETDIYGQVSFEDYFAELQLRYPSCKLNYVQSNIEGELINELHKASNEFDAVILNAGGYTHTSVAIHDAIKGIKIPVIEVHISNIYAREEFRRNSIIAPATKGVICGFGLKSYDLAIEAFLKM